MPRRSERRSPRAAGFSVSTALAIGLALHALALHQGALTLIQPLLVTGVLFTLPTSRYTGGPPVTAIDMRWATLLVAALATFLVAATPTSQPARNIDTAPAFLTLGFSLAGILVCLLIARGCRGDQVATVLGVASGIALAGSAALIKVSTDVLTRGVGVLLRSWQLYALVVVGGAALLLTQLAYRAGAMIASVPAINTVNPLVSVIIGIAVFDERFRTGSGFIALDVFSLAVVLLATTALSRRAAQQPAAGGSRRPQASCEQN